MKILVIGNGGREDAICRSVALSKHTTKLYCTPGNGGTARYAENISLSTNDEIVAFCVTNKIDLVIVGPEQPLVEGIVDMLQKQNIKVFGPNCACAQLEASKDYAKVFMQKYHIPTAKYDTVTSKQQGLNALSKYSYPLVIKADGLCAGKGVKICEDEASAVKYLEELFDENIFGTAGSVAVIEEFLYGKEASLLCFVSNNQLFPLESAKDYKRIFDNDEGENTGGVGNYSPSELFTPQLQKSLQDTLSKIETGLTNEGLDFTGILFIGFMIENNEVKILEFNVRFGDPETEVVLPRLESDLVELMLKAIDKTLHQDDFKWTSKKSLTVVLTSKGYPHAYEKGKLITGLDDVSDVYVYHNNTLLKEGNYYTNGGRVLSVTVLGDDFDSMRAIVYREIDKIHYEGKQFRKDIGILEK